MSDSKKIIFLDLDDTLLTSDKNISPATKAAIDDFDRAGNYVCICSGRAVFSVRKAYERFDAHWKNLYFSCFNGGMIYDPHKDEVLDRMGMDIDDVVDIFDIFLKNDVDCQTYTDEYIVTMRDSRGLRTFLKVEDDPYIIVDDLRKVLKVPPCKIIGIDVPDGQRFGKPRKEIEDKYAEKYYCMKSSPFYLEIIPVGSGKGRSVVRLCEILGIPRENSMACGDYENDISMIQNAGIGVAMINGLDSLKAVADIVTEKDNDHDGLCPIIKNFTEM